MIPVVLGLTAWIAKGVALTALPRLLKAVTACCAPTPKTCPILSPSRNQAVLQTPDRVIIYSYDNLSQLIGVNINSTPAATFGFDAAGNLQTLTTGNTTQSFTYNALNQRVTPGTNLYDPKGQTTAKDTRTFEWDDDGRMTAIVDGTHRSEFAYDGYGRRIKIAEFDNGVITSKKLYWWLGGQIVTEREGLTAGFPITKQYFGQGVIANGIKLFYTFDQLGSVRELIDSTGAIRSDYRYSTYGERTKESGDLDSDFGFAGLFHHGPSGLDLATYRTYDSKAGRWISRDPLGEGVDYNLYRYCGNSPINGSDPSGLIGPAIGAWEAGVWVVRMAPEIWEGTTAAAESLAPYAGSLLDMLPSWALPAAGTGTAASGMYIFNGSGAPTPMPQLGPPGKNPININLPGPARRFDSQKQGRHVQRDPNYKGGGYFNCMDDAKEVMDAFLNGRVQNLGTNKGGNPVFRYNGVTGYNNNPRSGHMDQPTNVFYVKGTSSASVVPMNPTWSP